MLCVCVCDVWLIQCRSYTIWCVARGVVLVLWIFPCVRVYGGLTVLVDRYAWNLLFIFKWPSFPVCVFNLDKPSQKQRHQHHHPPPAPATSITTIIPHMVYSRCHAAMSLQMSIYLCDISYTYGLRAFYSQYTVTWTQLHQHQNISRTINLK